MTDLLLASCEDVTPILQDVCLVHADPPWLYDNARVPRGDGTMAEIPYPVLKMPDIVRQVDAAYDAAGEHAYLLLWTTWPKIAEWFEKSAAMRWSFKSGGSWAKTGRMGIGYHWRGDSEPLLLYTKGSPKPNRAVSNTHIGPRAAHSEKPYDFLSKIVPALTPENGLVYDMYAGRAPLWRVCRDTGRQYVGAEIDAGRREAALASFLSPGLDAS